jgi:hypothetical protein
MYKYNYQYFPPGLYRRLEYGKFINNQHKIKKINNIYFDNCAICIEKLYKEYIVFKCSHSFHSLCINTWLNHKKECPMCRTKII